MKLLQNSKRHHSGNKRGGMLLLVLVIFAVSLILISSAMTVTLASRSRYYVDAERSQERLTLTCAAEAVIDAIETQELPDAELEKMINNGKYTVTGSSKDSASSGPDATNGKDIAPGLANAANSTTYFTVTKVSEGSEDLYLTFSTLIDATGENGQSENLRVRLKYTPPTPVTEICANMVTCGDPSSPDFVDVQRLYVDTNKSYTVLHGNVSITDGGETKISNTTVITGVAKGGSGTKYSNDVVFYGPKAGMDIKSGGNGFEIIPGKGDFYFLGVTVDGNSSTQSVLRNSDGTPGTTTGFNIVADGMYLYNSTLTTSDYTAGGGKTKYWVVGSKATVNRPNKYDGERNIIIKNGGTANITSVTTTVYESKDAIPASDTTAIQTYNRLTTKANNYMKDKALQTAASHHVPTSEEQSAAYGKYAAACLDNQLSSISYSNKVTNLDGGKNYAMSGTYSKGGLEIDLKKGTTYIYMSSNVKFDSFYIRVSNQYDAQLVIILAKGVTLSFGSPEFWNGGISGIISCDDRVSSKFSQPYQEDLRAKEGQKPAAMIVGLGLNQFKLGQAMVVDAYISLAGLGNEASTVEMQNGPHFYGRFESVKYHYTGGDPIKLSYCPSVNEEDNTPKPLSTCYTVDGYEYTYNI